MNERMTAKYAEALEFWNEAFMLTGEGRQKLADKIAADPTGIALASSAKLAGIMTGELAGYSRVLDYGCGRGWAGLCVKKAGCPDVTCVDVSQNAADSALVLAEMLGVNEGFTAMHVDREWLSGVEAGSFDGIVCSNVLDVVPTDVAEGILLEFARIAAPGARVVIGLNYYMEPKDNPERNITVEGENVFVDGILRMVTKTDEAWAELMGRYFRVEYLEHFGWTGEATERRRAFVLVKK